MRTDSGKIRILMVLGSTGIGGAQAFAMNVLRNIDMNKFAIDFAVNNFAAQGGIEEECYKYGCHFYQLPYFKVYNYITYKKAWEKFFSLHKYDIVYAHSTNSASIYLKIAQKFGMKTIAHSHSAGYRGNIMEQCIKKLFAKKVGKVANYWFSCSDIAAQRLFGKKYKTYDNYYSIPNAIDANKYLFDSVIRDNIRTKLNISNDTILYGHVGTFSTPKNHKFLIDIFAEISAIQPNSQLICCGTGLLLEATKEYAASKGIADKIIFAGAVNNVNEYLMAMDTFVFPSLFEGFPVAVLEAQASGLNIIMSNTITKEVDLTSDIHRMDLKQTPSEWAQKAISLDMTIETRVKDNAVIAESQYNIVTEVKLFEKLYIQLVSNE